MSIRSVSLESYSRSVTLEESRDFHLENQVSCCYKSSLENGYLNTYKALHLGGEDTQESRLIRTAITICPTSHEMDVSGRISTYNKISEHVSLLSEEEVSNLLATAKILGTGTGGDVLSMEIEGVPVFVKKIPMTDIEKKNPRSTANLFELPSYYQYGVGSMGFGVWRELLAHEMTTRWVLDGECPNFPLMYHARMIDRVGPLKERTSEELESLNKQVEYWDGSSAIRLRSESVRNASSDMVVFIEHLPGTLDKWMRDEVAKGDPSSDVTLTKVEREINDVVSFMKKRGLLHFDAHFHNILTDSKHVYFADFGLAISLEFDLSPKERAFFEEHKDYVASVLCESLICEAVGEVACKELLKEYRLTGKITATLPLAVELLVKKYLPIAVSMDRFFRDLRKTSKSTPYPFS